MNTEGQTAKPQGERRILRGNHKNKDLVSNLGIGIPVGHRNREALEILEYSWHQVPECSGHCQTLGCRSEL